MLNERMKLMFALRGNRESAAQVPALIVKDGKTAILDSPVICEYLEGQIAGVC
jgi:hypothetical protein